MTNNSFNPFSLILNPSLKDKVQRNINRLYKEKLKAEKKLDRLKEKFSYECQIHDLAEIIRAAEIAGYEAQFEYLCDCSVDGRLLPKNAIPGEYSREETCLGVTPSTAT